MEKSFSYLLQFSRLLRVEFEIQHTQVNRDFYRYI